MTVDEIRRRTTRELVVAIGEEWGIAISYGFQEWLGLS